MREAVPQGRPSAGTGTEPASPLLIPHVGPQEVAGVGSRTPGVRPVGPVPDGDYLIDLETGEMTPLPERIIGTKDRTRSYAASPDGSRLAYVGPGDDGSIFVANLNGGRAKQLTNGRGANSPTWSPDASRIAYIGRLGEAPDNVFVLDLATGESTQLTFYARSKRNLLAEDAKPERQAGGPLSFSPDGSSIVYNVGRQAQIVRIAGGEKVRKWRPHRGPSVRLGAMADARLSPDGSQLSYGCLRAICLANADGTNARVLVRVGIDALTSASWSPDGTRIASRPFHSLTVIVVDVATGDWTDVAPGDSPVWLDDHTLIVKHATTACGPC